MSEPGSGRERSWRVEMKGSFAGSTEQLDGGLQRGGLWALSALVLPGLEPRVKASGTNFLVTMWMDTEGQGHRRTG